MIPFGLFQAFLITDQDTIEVRALDLSPDSFSIRLAPIHQHMLPAVKSLKLIFYSPVSKQSTTTYPQTYQIIETDSQPFYKVYRIDIIDHRYQEEALRLSREYLTYIERKTTLLPEEVSHAYYPSYPEDQEEQFYPDWDSQQAAWGKEVMDGIKEAAAVAGNANANELLWESDKEQFRLGITLKYHNQIIDWLKMDPKAYLQKRFTQAGMSGHPLTRIMPTYIYVGDSYCPLLFPRPDSYQSLIAHCKQYQQKLVFQLAPVSESLLQEICKQLQCLNQQLLAESYPCEIEVGDIGMLQYCKNLNGFARVSKGPLLCKKRKDPRFKYQKTDMQYWEADSFADSEIPEGKTILQNLDESEDAVYLPYYQTNTGTFCTLQALRKNGDRSRQTRILHCSGICEKHSILYPSHLDMVGIGNSLYGFNKESLLQDFRIIKKRIIINL